MALSVAELTAVDFKSRCCSLPVPSGDTRASVPTRGRDCHVSGGLPVSSLPGRAGESKENRQFGFGIPLASSKVNKHSSRWQGSQ